MQNIQMNLKTDTEPDFMGEFLDDVIVFSKTVEEHIHDPRANSGVFRGS